MGEADAVPVVVAEIVACNCVVAGRAKKDDNIVVADSIV
jgi:hypothetical protein